VVDVGNDTVAVFFTVSVRDFAETRGAKARLFCWGEYYVAGLFYDFRFLVLHGCLLAQFHHYLCNRKSYACCRYISSKPVKSNSWLPQRGRLYILTYYLAWRPARYWLDYPVFFLRGMWTPTAWFTYVRHGRWRAVVTVSPCQPLLVVGFGRVCVVLAVRACKRAVVQ
jgi:hypothetical protein